MSPSERTAERNVFTIEDPIEFLFHNDQCTSPREWATTPGSPAALVTPCATIRRHRHREMRDLPRSARRITAPEPGHLVSHPAPRSTRRNPSIA
jgi:hypothetical protein